MKTPKNNKTADSLCSPARRNMITAGVGGLGMIALGGVAKCTAPQSLLLRPPGARSEDEFLALCLKCDRCRSVCPQSVISMPTIFDGLVNLRTPVLDFRHGYCDFCNKCIDVCPTGALADEKREEKSLGMAHLTESCIALRTSGCTKCYDKCPEKAITLNNERVPLIDESKCTGCGLCELVCPAHVLQSFKSDTERGIVIRPFKPGEKASRTAKGETK